MCRWRNMVQRKIKRGLIKIRRNRESQVVIGGMVWVLGEGVSYRYWVERI